MTPTKTVNTIATLAMSPGRPLNADLDSSVAKDSAEEEWLEILIQSGRPTRVKEFGL
jgi:hypothetical protein